MSKEKAGKLPLIRRMYQALICRMCKAGLVKYMCKVCPPMTKEEAHALNVQMRIDEESKGIVSNVDPETRKYFADMRKQMDKDKGNKGQI